jgi:hypothetical protein
MYVIRIATNVRISNFLFIHSPTDNIHPLIFYILAIVNGAAINMGLQMALQHRQEKI